MVVFSSYSCFSVCVCFYLLSLPSRARLKPVAARPIAALGLQIGLDHFGLRPFEPAVATSNLATWDRETGQHTRTAAGVHEAAAIMAFQRGDTQ